jgi:hypothetical protein
MAENMYIASNDEPKAVEPNASKLVCYAQHNCPYARHSTQGSCTTVTADYTRSCTATDKIACRRPTQ